MIYHFYIFHIYNLEKKRIKLYMLDEWYIRENILRLNNIGKFIK